LVILLVLTVVLGAVVLAVAINADRGRAIRSH
ncbi:MAG: hypothetical protein QOC92_683, partial [Acidimicrobiaceae bacterium]